MQRRELLGAVGAGVAVGLAGCASGSGGGSSPFEHPGTLGTTFATNGDYPEDDDPADGLPPAFDDPPAAPAADPSSFETLDVNGETVRLAPIDAVHAWYRRGDARFVDARGLSQYESAHVYGAVLSTAMQGSTGGGIDGWSTDDRIVTYCRCPHHLSSVRAAGLQKAGFTNVFAIDEGFGAWSDRSYAMGGTSFKDGDASQVTEWTIEGTVAAEHAGAYAWASGERQYEAAPIDANGAFTLHLTFVDVDATTPIEVSTPTYTVTKPLGELADGTVSE